MKELPTLQEVIVRRANKKLDDDMRIFRDELDKLCKRHSGIVEAVSFPYSEDPNLDANDKCPIDNLFYKNSVKQKIKEKLLPWYVEKEVSKMIEAIDRVPAVPELSKK